MVLSARTTPAVPATAAARTPRTTNAPAPPLASGPAPSSAAALEAPRLSGGRRLTALTLLVSAARSGALNRVGPRPQLHERVEVPVDDVVAHEQGDDATQRQPRPERDALLAALGRPVAGDDDAADGDTGDQRDEDRGRDGAPEEEPEHAGELDVAHPHAGRIHDRGQ